MRSNSRPAGQERPSFIEEARRQQIVETAIRTIASRGYSRASLAEIARDAGISKGVISYYFRGKSELVEEILGRLLKEPARYVKERVDSQAHPLEKLRAYVVANFEFMKQNRNHYVALVDLWGSLASDGRRSSLDTEAYGPSRAYLSNILEAGRASGELPPAPGVAGASVIQAAIDGVMLQWVFDPGAVDLDACRDEILEMMNSRFSPRGR